MDTRQQRLPLEDQSILAGILSLLDPLDAEQLQKARRVAVETHDDLMRQVTDEMNMKHQILLDAIDTRLEALTWKP